MARESSAFVGSGISVLRHVHNVPAMGGSNAVVVNYEDINSMMGVVQTSGLIIGSVAVQLTGPATRLRGRRQLMISNSGVGVLFIGNSGVTVNNGYPMANGTQMTLDVLDFGHIYGVSASTSIVRVLEMK